MSDPNYMHEFWPNRKGLCKQIVGDRHCGKPEDFIVHNRYKQYTEEECKRGDVNEATRILS